MRFSERTARSVSRGEVLKLSMNGVVGWHLRVGRNKRFLGLERQDGLGGRMIPGPHFSAGRAMLAVHYDDQVPSPPSLLKCVVKAFGLATNQHYFGATGESLLRGKSEGSLSDFCTSWPSSRTGNPLGRLASEVLGLSNARVIAALRQQLPGDSSHQTCRSQNCDVGLFQALACICKSPK